MKEEIKELREMVTRVQLEKDLKSPDKVKTPTKGDEKREKMKDKGYNSFRNSPKESVSSTASKVTILRNADERGFMDSIQDHEVLDGQFERH